jgi:hypothetical protein
LGLSGDVSDAIVDPRQAKLVHTINLLADSLEQCEQAALKEWMHLEVHIQSSFNILNASAI